MIFKLISPSLIILCSIILCGCTNNETNKDIPINKPDFDSTILQKYSAFNNYFTHIKSDSFYVYSNENIYEDSLLRGIPIDSSIAYSQLSSLLSFKSKVNADFFAIGEIKLSANHTGYIIRHPSSISSTKISLFIYDASTKEFTKRIDLADYVGDEGIEIIRKSVIKTNEKNFEILTHDITKEHGIIKKDSSYATTNY